MLIVNALIVFALIVLNGFFAMSEIAVVSSRKSRLEQMRDEGRRGAGKAIALIENPTDFLSTVQIGITLVGIFAGAYGGSVFAEPLAAVMADWPVIGPYAETLAFVCVVVVITYLSLVVGELAPKRLALAKAEVVAATVAPFMVALAKVGSPIVWLLGVSTTAITGLFGIAEEREDAVTEEDVRSMIAEGTRRGVFKPRERELLEGVIRVSDRTVRSIMVPRPDTVWLALSDDVDDVLREIAESEHSRYPVIDTEKDEVAGIVQTKDLLEIQRRGQKIDIEKAMRTAIYVHETMPILRLLETFRSSDIHMAVVLDEYGSFEGIATPMDILKGIAGNFPEGTDDEVSIVQRADGSLLVDGATPVDLVAHRLERISFPEDRDYETLAGFILAELGHIPEIGEILEAQGWQIEIVDLDGHRIDKVLFTHLATSDEPGERTAKDEAA